MSDNSAIEWTDATWNPVRGCTKVSPGCANCYAETFAERFRGVPGHAYEQGFDLRLVPEALEVPLRWRKPKRIFVNSMSDLFHESVPDEFIDRVFDVMWRCPQHTFQILTKRVDRMVSYVRARASARRFGWVQRDRYAMKPGEFISLDDIRMRNMCGYVGVADWSCDHPYHEGAEDSCDASDCPIAYRVDERAKLEEIGIADEYTFGTDGYAESNGSDWLELTNRPLHAACGNVWLGFSAENQRLFEERARLFRSLRDDLGPNFVLFVSLEPLLGPISFEMPYWPDGDEENPSPWTPLAGYDFSCAGHTLTKPYLDWVIVGGESGPGSRPFDVAWARSIVKQCQAAGVPVFVKQLGARPLVPAGRQTHWDYRFVKRPEAERFVEHDAKHWRMRPLSPKGGDTSEWPVDLRVREFPKVQA